MEFPSTTPVPRVSSDRELSSTRGLWRSLLQPWCQFQLRLAPWVIPGGLPGDHLIDRTTDLLRPVAGGLLKVADSTVMYK